MKTDQNIFI